MTFNNYYSSPSNNCFEEPTGFSYIIIKITNDVVYNREHGDRYEATRKYWKLNPDRADRYQYVFSVTDQIVREVYQVVGPWSKTSNPNEYGRYEFKGIQAPEEIRNKYIGKRIPQRFCKKGSANPIQYSN